MDAYALWKAHDSNQMDALEQLPVCDCCGEHIQDEHLYLISGEILCMDCLNDQYRRDVDDFIEGE